MSKGGAEKVISILLPYLIKDYNVSLVLLVDDIKYDIPSRVKIHTINTSRSSLNRILTFPKSIVKYYNFVKRNNIDISISFLIRPNIINGLMRYFFRDMKIIISERCYPSIAYKSSRMKYYLYKFLIPFTYNNANFVFSNSYHINTDLQTNFQITTPLKLLYNPVILPIDFKRRIVNDLSIIKLITVGSLYYVKNQKLIINSLIHFRENFILTILGDGVLMNDLQALTVKNNLSDKIIFKGTVDNVNDFLNESDIFILSSDTEGFPNCILEAMAMGLPIISTNCKSGPLEILNENKAIEIGKGKFKIAKYGILIETNDEIGLTNALNFLAYNRELKKELSRLSLIRASHYNSERIYSEFRLLLNL
tara:strand:+ start:78 stop:1172 length:1095 start_codon:yes stop_codon:yes gene_type:complete